MREERGEVERRSGEEKRRGEAERRSGEEKRRGEAERSTEEMRDETRSEWREGDDERG